nr:hypothetical protein CcurKRNrm1_p064 [Cryptomonas curvata]
MKNNDLQKKNVLLKKPLEIFNINSIFREFLYSQQSKNILFESFILDKCKNNFQIKNKNIFLGRNFKKKYFSFSCRLFILKNKYLNRKSLLIQFHTKKLLAIQISVYLIRLKLVSNIIDKIRYIIHISNLISNKSFLDLTSIIISLNKVKLIKKFNSKKKILVYALKIDF